MIERRVLEKVLDNLNHAYDVIDDMDDLNDSLQTANYDIVFTDSDLVTDEISQSYANLAIITSSNSKDEIESVIKKHRG